MFWSARFANSYEQMELWTDYQSIAEYLLNGIDGMCPQYKDKTAGRFSNDSARRCTTERKFLASKGVQVFPLYSPVLASVRQIPKLRFFVDTITNETGRTEDDLCA